MRALLIAGIVGSCFVTALLLGLGSMFILCFVTGWTVKELFARCWKAIFVSSQEEEVQ